MASGASESLKMNELVVHSTQQGANSDKLPGLVPGRLELVSNDHVVVRLFDGTRLTAHIANGVDTGLVEDCVRYARPVLLVETPTGPTVIGALQTTRVLEQEPDGKLNLRARDITLNADRRLVLEAGPVRITLDRRGGLRLQGDRLTVDMGAIVRFFAGRVEFP